jgi:uncharacterized protein GlcG (DUF336 family)
MKDKNSSKFAKLLNEKILSFELRSLILLELNNIIEELDIDVWVAIADKNGLVVSLERFRKANLCSDTIAMAKARASAIKKIPSSKLRSEYVRLMGNQMTNLKGGLPIFIKKECIGAVGISGGTPDQDLAIAEHLIIRINEIIKE